MFNPEVYNQSRFAQPGISDHSYTNFLLKCLARHYGVTMSSVAPNSLKILDYGCGPSIGLSISAAFKASELVLADIAEVNREYVRKWLDKDPSICSFWSPFFKYVTQTLEGGSEKDAVEREEMLRDRIKAVVPCDITKEAFIEDAYNKKGAYDVVFSSLCLDSGCKDLASYESGIEKLVSLVKQGGYLLLYSTRREHDEEGFYFVNGVKFFNVSLKKDYVLNLLKRNGLCVMYENYLPLPPKPHIGNSEGFIYIGACKVQLAT